MEPENYREQYIEINLVLILNSTSHTPVEFPVNK